MIFEFSGEAIWWRGPAPYVFVATPPEVSAGIKSIAARVTYGWGCIPATVTILTTEYTTSLFPKDGGYHIPIKAAVQRAEGIAVGDAVVLRLEIADA